MAEGATDSGLHNCHFLALLLATHGCGKHNGLHSDDATLPQPLVNLQHTATGMTSSHVTWLHATVLVAGMPSKTPWPSPPRHKQRYLQLLEDTLAGLLQGDAGLLDQQMMTL